ncbi:hypothetical protein O3G_MSEX012000 [Manduca sexta]|uniref:Homeobox domain-containing protein n=1 Tax=Manduca sexta TaxID=7130 RepID=A0A921ZMB6_MANSE|nr:hypothetical protein O3G_MSEX012000 [Manduca sexta]
MDSPVQSTSKCLRSDFSIERILSDDSGSSRERTIETPSWLCCTRYRPPRVPRSVNSGCKSRRSGRHARVPFTAAQASALEAAYARAPYLAPPALRALAAALQLRDDRIKIWFQNRRARERREKYANIIPPVGVTLPPSSMHRGLMNAHMPWMALEKAEEKNVDCNMYAEAPAQISTECHNENESPQKSCSFVSPRNSASSEEDRPESPLDVESLEE